MSAVNLEIEVKLEWHRSIVDAQKRLLDGGFHVSRDRAFEINLVFDTPDSKLGRQQKLVRLRREREVSILTYKGPPIEDKHKVREEIETEVSEHEKLHLILNRLGFDLVFRYEKYRTEYFDAERLGTVTLDETPIGTFFEIEGPPDWIDRSARRLGFAESEYITASYGALFREYCRAHNITRSHMVFEPS